MSTAPPHNSLWSLHFMSLALLHLLCVHISSCFSYLACLRCLPPHIFLWSIHFIMCLAGSPPSLLMCPCITSALFPHLCIHHPHMIPHLVKLPGSFSYLSDTVLCLIFISEAVLPQLLNALCSGNITPVEHLEQQQVSIKLMLLHAYMWKYVALVRSIINVFL